MADQNIKDEPFDLTDQDSNITKANATAAVWSDLYKYQVPVGCGHVLQAGHTFSIYLMNTSSTANAGTDLVKIERRDSAEQDHETIYGPAIYGRCGEFSDRNKLARLNVSAPVKVLERQWIVVMVKGATAAGTASSYFDLAINKVRQGLV
jgi:hypothetical protein